MLALDDLDTPATDRLDAIADAERQRQHLPGLAVAVARRGEILHAGGYGAASLELAVPVTPETVFCIGSLTKQFTAALTLQLVETGTLHLDEPVYPHFADRLEARIPSEFREAWRQITVRHLLTHTSGLKRDPVRFRPTENTLPPNYIPDLYAWARQEFTGNDLLDQLAMLPLDFAPPGTKMSYSNAGYTLLGLLIEKVTGHSFAACLRERITGPLGMTATRLTEEEVIPHLANGYTWAGEEEGGWRKGGYLNPTRDAAAGSLVSTVLDLVRWDSAFHDDAFLLPASRAALWTPAALNDGTTLPYGLGWGVGTRAEGAGPHHWVGHGGMWGGFTSHWVRFVEKDLTVVALTNLGISGRVPGGGQRGEPGQVSWLLAAQFLPGLPRPGS
ncbi:MAG: beta-lactamase family protein [Cytophagales bacterium]|nr:beta-lactamase family protein [Armatimonadota bacterium]